MNEKSGSSPLAASASNSVNGTKCGQTILQPRVVDQTAVAENAVRVAAT